MLLLRRILFILVSCFAFGLPHTVLAGVYPNYRPHYDFVTWDKDQTIEKLASHHKWWQTASFYQIYPRSFKDSNGDGIGDLNGIAEKLPYLKEIGITATWLSPIFKSPMADFGYDIANFTSIDPIFGSIADFAALMQKAQEVGVKIILDFVPNHTSDECEWFKKSAAGDPEYKDFYVWHPGKEVDGVRHPPTNWVSVFRGSAWQWHEGRQEYYLHQFLRKQPDLNYRNPKVVAAMNEVLLFWLQKGVAGFRIDAVPSLFEVTANASGNWPDEPRNPASNDPDDYGYLQHVYTVDQPETIDLLYQWRRVLDSYQQEHGGDERIILAETYSPIDVVMQYYGNKTAEGAQIPFNFLLITQLTNDSDAYHYAEVINTWLQNMPPGRTPNWVIGNHDQNRVGSRLGADRIDMLNQLILGLPGCSITYLGEEIGMTDVWISWNDTVDPSACNSNPDMYEKLSRDPERTPFQWNTGPNAGFSTAAKTWLPISEHYKDVNVEIEQPLLLSHLGVFKEMQALRKENTFKFGSVQLEALRSAVLAVKRVLLHDHSYVLLLNLNDSDEKVDLIASFPDLPNELEYVLVTSRTKGRKGDIVSATEVHLAPKDSVVLRSVTKLTTSVGYYTYYAVESEITKTNQL